MTDERQFDTGFSPAVSVADAASNGTGDHADATVEGVAPEQPSELATRAEAPEAKADAAGTEIVAAEAPDFLTQLARAMQATAGAERSRVAQDVDGRRSALVAAIHARRDVEVARMRELADEDRKGIDSWAETEHRRIQVERERRTTELQADLARSLDEHRRQVDGRVAAVEAAVAAHRSEVDAFFDSLGAETDPVRIAQQAGRRPAFPDLEATVNAAEPTPAEPEPAVVGVMDPIARLGLLTSTDDFADASTAGSPAGTAPEASPPLAAAYGPSVLTPVAARMSGRPEDTSESMAATPPPASSSGHNPIGWLRRGNDQGDR